MCPSELGIFVEGFIHIQRLIFGYPMRPNVDDAGLDETT